MFNERLAPKTQIKVNENVIPLLVISAQALNKMWTYVAQCHDEIGWLGTVRKESNRVYYLDDVYLFHQQVHATTTEITTEGLSEFANEILMREDGMEVWNNLRVWGHSHVNMGVFASGQDDAQMKFFQEGGNDYFFRIICNKKGELCVDFFNYISGVTYLDIPWEVLISQEEEDVHNQIKAMQDYLATLRTAQLDTIKSDITAEMKEKVKKLVYQYPSSYTNPNYQQQIGFYQQNLQLEKKQNTTERMVEKKLQVMNGGTTDTATRPRIIHSLMDIYIYFDKQDLLSLATCASHEQMQEEIFSLGIMESFSSAELSMIWEEGYHLLEGKMNKSGLGGN